MEGDLEEMGKILVDEYMDAGLAVMGMGGAAALDGGSAGRTDAHQA